MPRRLLTWNILLGVLVLGLAAYIVRELIRPAPSSAPAQARGAAPAGAAATAAANPAPPSSGSHAIIASRNLFSPTRTEAPGAGGVNQAMLLPKPNLYGVVLRDGAPIAYIEDPVTKRVAGYRVGDTVAGGTLTKIAADHVVLARPEGAVDVRLHDPARPRPALPAAPGQAPPGQAPPGQFPPGPFPPGQFQPGPVPPGRVQPTGPGGPTPPPQQSLPGVIPPVMPAQSAQPPPGQVIQSPLQPPSRRPLPNLRRPGEGTSR